MIPKTRIAIFNAVGSRNPAIPAVAAEAVNSELWVATAVAAVLTAAANKNNGAINK